MAALDAVGRRAQPCSFRVSLRLCTRVSYLLLLLLDSKGPPGGGGGGGWGGAEGGWFSLAGHN